MRALRSTISQPAAVEPGGDQVLGGPADPLSLRGHRGDARAESGRSVDCVPSVDERRRRFAAICAPRVGLGSASVAAVLATAQTFTLDGIAARPVRVEVDVHRGLPAFSRRRPARRGGARGAGAGPGGAGQLRLRVPAAADRRQPRAGQPAQGRPGLDLAIAAALLAASGQLDWERLPRLALAGELALDGSVRPVPGVLAIAEAARERGAEAIVVPAENGPEAALVEGIEVICLESLGQLSALAGGRVGAGPAAAVAAAAERRRRRARPRRPARPALTSATRSRSRRPAATAC